MSSALIRLFKLDGYRIFRILFLPNQGAFALSIAVATLSLGLESVSLISLIPILDAINKGQTALHAFGFSLAVKYAIPVLASLILARIALNFVSRYIPVKVSSWVAARVRDQILHNLMVFRKGWDVRVNTGDTVKRIDNNVYTATGAFQFLVAILAGSLTIAVFFALMIRISPKLSLLSILFFGTIHLVTLFINKRVSRSSSSLAEDAKSFFPQVLDIARAAPIIRSFRSEPFFKAMAHAKIESMRVDEVRFLAYMMVVPYVSELLSFLFLMFNFFLLWTGVIDISFSTFLVFFYTAHRAIANFKEVLVSNSNLIRCRDHASLVEPLLTADTLAPYTLGSQGAQPPTVMRESLELSGVGYAYGEGKYVLRNLDLKIAKCEKVAILGESGAGKSTLLSLLLGLESPGEGVILVDGRPIGSGAEMTALSCYVSQEPYVFKLDIARNVSLSEEYDEARVREVLRQANLWPYVENLPRGMHTPVGDGELEMSVGQKQRLVIARALYKNSDLLLMDEPTSALDPENSRQIMREIFSLFRDKTIIAVTHSHEFLPMFGAIYTLKAGTMAPASVPEIAKHI